MKKQVHTSKEKELARWTKALEKPMTGGYFWFLMAVLTLVYIIDEITSAIPSALTSEIVEEFFVRGMGMDLNTGLAAFVGMSSPFYALLAIAPFYKALSDRFGRRAFLVINTLGMALGLWVCFAATNIYTYLVGLLIIRFVIPNDMQVMYIMECAPEKHRAKLCSMTKAVALLGVTLIPVLRTVFMGSDGSKWRQVHLVPAIIAAAVGIAALAFLRETPVFIRRRIHRLQKGEEAAEVPVKKEKGENGGVIQAVKFIFRHKQTRYLAICALVFAAGTAVTSFYETIMKSGGMTTEQITTAMYFYPFFNALFTAAGGFITDSVGRKGSALIQSAIAAVSLAAFIITSNMGVSAVAVGICYGLFLGSLWSVSDLLFLIMPGESTPTHLRASVIGTMGLMLGLGTALATVLVSVVSVFLPGVPLGWIWFAACIPFMAAAVIILLLKVHETKDNDLATVTGEEWD